MKKLTVFILLFIFPASYAAAQSRVEVIQLKHRTAEEMLPILRPILGEGGTITGNNYTLIIKAKPRGMRSAKQVLAKLDKALRNLRIIVKQGTRSQLNARSAGLSARIPLSNKGTVRLNPGGAAGGGQGLSGRFSRDGHSVSGRLHGESRSEDVMRTQQVVTVEGRPARIHIGQRIPFQTFTQNEGASVEFHDVAIGFSVLARVNGNNVFLEIDSENSETGPGGINFQEVHTTVTGRLGQWIEIGALAETQASDGRGVLAGDRIRASDRRTVFIKVVEARNQR